ncbi:hypothetical protein D3C86_2006410 [compost metagenome]
MELIHKQTANIVGNTVFGYHTNGNTRFPRLHAQSRQELHHRLCLLSIFDEGHIPDFMAPGFIHTPNRIADGCFPVIRTGGH